MMRLLGKRFGQWGIKSAEYSSGRLVLELLDSRVLLSSVVNDLGVLIIDCDDGENNVTISPGSHSREVIVTGDPSHPEAQTISGVKEIIVNGDGGSDVITVDFEVKINTTLNGGSGNDILKGGGGDDIIRGGEGNDTMSSSPGLDSYDGGEDTDSFEASSSATKGVQLDLGEGEIKRDGFDGKNESIDGIEVVWGSKYSDVLIGNDEDNQLHGGDGPDRLDGKGGENHLFGGDGDDRIKAGDGDNKNINGGKGNDIIEVGDGDNEIWGGEDADRIKTGSGNNTIWDLGGSDRLETGNGNNAVEGPGPGGESGQSLKIQLGDGNNTVDLELSDDGKLSLKTGDGDNDVTVAGQSHCSLKMALGDGNDTLDINSGDHAKIGIKDSVGDCTGSFTSGSDSSVKVKLGIGNHDWDITAGSEAKVSLNASGNNTGTVNGGAAHKFNFKNGSDTITGSNCQDSSFKLGDGFDSLNLTDSSNCKLQMGPDADNVDLTRVNNGSVKLGTCGADVFVREQCNEIAFKGGKGNDHYNFFERLGLGQEPITVKDPGGDNFFVTGQGRYDLQGGSGTDQFQLGYDAGWGRLDGGSGAMDFLAIDPGISGLNDGVLIDFDTGHLTVDSSDFSIGGFEYGRGSHLDDTIIAGKLTERISGGAGNDIIDAHGLYLYLVDGESGNDTLIGGDNVQHVVSIET
jgi:Ca2+-binding RTX toxin-like protein